MAVNPARLRYDPAIDGPPTWPGTADTIDEFNKQAEQFRMWLVSSGLGTQVTPGGAITNAVPYFPGSPSPDDIRAYLFDPVVNADRLKLDPVAAAPAAVSPPLPVVANAVAPPNPDPPVRDFDPFNNPDAITFVPNPGNFGGVGPLRLDVIQQRYGGLPSNPSAPMSFPATFLPLGTAPGGGSLGLSAGQVGGVINQANPCQFVPDGPLRVACQIAQGLFNAASGQPNPGGNLGQTQFAPGSNPAPGGGPCSVGYHWSDVLNTCVSDNVTNWLPGGTPATVPIGTPIGGVGGVKPRQVGSVQRNDGKVTPLFRCPRGMVLGVDYNCYWRQMLPRQWRAHRPAARPLLSAHDGSVLRKAKGLEKKLRKVTNKHVHKPCHCHKTTGRKK